MMHTIIPLGIDSVKQASNRGELFRYVVKQSPLLFFIFISKQDVYHDFSRSANPQLEIAQKTLVFSHIIKREPIAKPECFYQFSQLIAGFFLQVTSFNVNNLIKKTPGMITRNILIRGKIGIMQLMGLQILLIAESIFDLVPVMPDFFGPNYWKDRGKRNFTDPAQVICYLLLFVLKLIFVRQHLPLAPTAYPKM